MDSNWLHPFVLDRALPTAVYLAACFAAIAGFGYFISRHRDKPAPYYLLAALYGGVVIAGAIALKAEMFDHLRLLCFGIFLGGFILCDVWTILAWPKLKRTAYFFAICSVVLAVTALDAFVMEPHDLQISHYKIVSEKVNRPLRIAVLSDLQTDHVGPYEKEALLRMMDEHPDLVLFPGDYIQEYRSTRYNEELLSLARALQETRIRAPRGAFAVPGNVDQPGWQYPFMQSGIRTIPSLETVHQIGLDVTGLSLEQSFDPRQKVERKSRAFHVVVGHCPNFMLGDIDADLLVAGHTHGGQVQLPFFGPPMTLTAVPRDLARGNLIKSKDNRYMVVTRGVGMERNRAPRLRFLCKPEITIIDVMPATPMD